MSMTLRVLTRRSHTIIYGHRGPFRIFNTNMVSGLIRAMRTVNLYPITRFHGSSMLIDHSVSNHGMVHTTRLSGVNEIMLYLIQIVRIARMTDSDHPTITMLRTHFLTTRQDRGLFYFLYLRNVQRARGRVPILFLSFTDDNGISIILRHGAFRTTFTRRIRGII